MVFPVVCRGLARITCQTGGWRRPLTWDGFPDRGRDAQRYRQARAHGTGPFRRLVPVSGAFLCLLLVVGCTRAPAPRQPLKDLTPWLGGGVAWPVCVGRDRAARGVTCVVDGDTFWLSGVKYRLACVDAVEVSERDGRAARGALARLLATPGARLAHSGRSGRYGRDLVRVTGPDWDAGTELVRAALARPVDYSTTRAFCRAAV